MKVVSLYINNHHNIEVRFEIIVNINTIDEATYNEKEGTIRDLLISTKHNDALLFNSVKKGKGKKSNTLYLLMISKLRTDTQEWLRRNLGIMCSIQPH